MTSFDLLLAAAHPLVHLNASLNTIAILLLVAGLVLIKQGRETAHRWTMAAAIFVSTAFLVSYLWYHYNVGHVPFTAEGPIRYVYYAILITHIPLAMTVPVFALLASYYGWRAMDGPVEQSPAMRARHRAVVRWGYPIWMYVSVTGVIVYLMLYHLWPTEALDGAV